ncbi:MAG TPA: GNAT family N-acetyltransferase [Alphaproteobacteria bacterium]|nr:GNAT family N-acetyltransferase [Alphaproteobacteria bacterium]
MKSHAAKPRVTAAIRTANTDDLPAIAALLRERKLAKGGDLRQRLKQLVESEMSDCFVAEEGGRVVGAVLSAFNGFNVFVSHIAVEEDIERKGIGSALIEAVVTRAVERKATGLVVDSRLTSTTFFFRHGFRLPGAVLMIRDL